MINLIIFIGLIISGFSLILGCILALLDMFEYLAGILLGSGVYLGLLFAIFAIISFVAGTVILLTGRLDNYWRTLYPLNFGLALLGGSFILYNWNFSIPGIIAVMVFSLGVSCALYKIKAINTRWLAVILTGALFVKSDFWGALAIGMVFVSLSVAEGAMKKVFR
jgi:hypothetical protein